MATQMQLKVLWREIARQPGILERKKQQQGRVYFDVIFDVCSERTRASDLKQRWRIPLEKKTNKQTNKKQTWKFHSDGEEMRNASGQQQEAPIKLKMSVGKKNNNNREQNFWWAHVTIPPQN